MGNYKQYEPDIYDGRGVAKMTSVHIANALLLGLMYNPAVYPS